jgi:hypothetical protein
VYLSDEDQRMFAASLQYVPVPMFLVLSALTMSSRLKYFYAQSSRLSR